MFAECHATSGSDVTLQNHWHNKSQLGKVATNLKCGRREFMSCLIFIAFLQQFPSKEHCWRLLEFEWAVNIISYLLPPIINCASSCERVVIEIARSRSPSVGLLEFKSFRDLSSFNFLSSNHLANICLLFSDRKQYNLIVNHLHDQHLIDISLTSVSRINQPKINYFTSR